MLGSFIGFLGNFLRNTDHFPFFACSFVCVIHCLSICLSFLFFFLYFHFIQLFIRLEQIIYIYIYYTLVVFFTFSFSFSYILSPFFLVFFLLNFDLRKMEKKHNHFFHIQVLIRTLKQRKNVHIWYVFFLASSGTFYQGTKSTSSTLYNSIAIERI